MTQTGRAKEIAKEQKRELNESELAALMLWRVHPSTFWESFLSEREYEHARKVIDRVTLKERDSL